MSTTAVAPTSNRHEAAVKANATRKARKLAQMKIDGEERQARSDKFDAMTEADQQAMIARLEELQYDYSTKIEEFENELYNELDEELADVVKRYGWAEVKCSLEHDASSLVRYNAQIDFDALVDNHGPEVE